MGGRQAHGRPLLGGGDGGKNKRKQQRSNAKSSKKALNAFAIAQEEYAERPKLNPRNRELADLGKHGRDDSDDEERPRKMRRGARDDDEDEDSGSGSEDFKIGVDEDDDSEIESDDAFGDSDEERFQGYAFRGSKKKAEEGDEDDTDDADGSSLGSDAIDLAAALDMSMSEDDGDDAEADQDESGSDEESSESSSQESDDEDEDDDDVEDSGIKDFVNKFSGVKDQDDDDQDITAPTTGKLDLKDLGLLGIKDPQLRKSLKMMTKEEKSSKPKKLLVPKPQRQQAALDRSVAYEKTNKTLDRWTETVKQNRRADHLVFAPSTGLTVHDNEIQPLSRQPITELEEKLLGIMEESGLGPQKPAAKTEDDDAEQTLSRRDIWEKRRERELKSRQDAIAKRLKKIKSKTYHKIHRRGREREEMKIQEAQIANGEVDLDELREARDRQRAEERMGARHRESKWAKMNRKTGAWNEDVRMGLAEMNRRDQELRQRKEGKAGVNNSEEESDSDDSEVDERKRLLKELNEIGDGADDDGPGSKLMNLPFMKKSEAAKKRANDEAIAQIRRDLASDGEDFDDPDSETEEVGRRSYGVPAGNQAKKPKAKAEGLNPPEHEAKKENLSKVIPTPTLRDHTNTTAGAWSSAQTNESRRKKRGKTVDSSVGVLDLDASAALVHVPEPKPAPKPKPSRQRAIEVDLDSSDHEDGDIVQFHDQDLLKRAFGGADVVADFEKEKRLVEEEDDEKEVDSALPGWGSWVGEGVKKKHKPRLVKQDGINKKDRKDAKLKRVILNEKPVKKNVKYLASQLPHEFETAHQYERSLRLPVGPEWVTKETFQNATKPRVIVKQGIIAPMSKPMQ